MKSKKTEDKTYLSPDEYEDIKGSREQWNYQYNPEKKRYEKNLRKIRGALKAWLKSDKFLLRLDAPFSVYYFIGKGDTITTDRKEALTFAYGFDEEDVKLQHYFTKYGIKLKVEKHTVNRKKYAKSTEQQEHHEL